MPNHLGKVVTKTHIHKLIDEIYDELFLQYEETILDDLFVHSMDWRVLYKTIERKLRGELK